MEKRSTRCNRDKKTQHKETIKVAKSLTTGLAMCSLLITGAAQATGQTYSTFSDVERVNTQVSMCPVFPSTIEKKFSDLTSHIEALLQIEKKIRNLPSVSISTHSPSIPENPSEADLEQVSEEIEKAEKSYYNQATKIKTNKTEFSNLRKQILKELQGIKSIVQDLKSYRNYDPNCLEIDKHHILNLFKEKITTSWSLHQRIIMDCNSIADQYKTNSSPRRSFQAMVQVNTNWSEDFLELERDWSEQAEENISKLNNESQSLLRMKDEVKQNKEELKEEEREERLKQEEKKKQEELEEQKENKEKNDSPEETTKENTSDQPENPVEKKEEKPKEKPKDDPPKEEKAPPAKKEEPKPSEPKDKKEKKEEPAPEPPKEKEKSETPPDKEEAKKEKPPEKAPLTKEDKKEKEDKKSDTED